MCSIGLKNKTLTYKSPASVALHLAMKTPQEGRLLTQHQQLETDAASWGDERFLAGTAAHPVPAPTVSAYTQKRMAEERRGRNTCDVSG